jgi:hypothetical protein
MNLKIVVGDAPGIDTAVQKYLAERCYQNVTVYAARKVRSNVGSWSVVMIEGNYVDRDIAMSKVAGWLLAFWDGKSPGTGNNISRFAPDMRRVFYSGINIYSGTKGLGGALTNPTEISHRKGSIKKHYPITFRERRFPDSETAYRKFKTGTDSDYELMVEILVEKLRQYPILVNKISARGGIEWLSRCQHTVNGRSRWEGIGANSKFITCLIDAYKVVMAES